MGTKRWNQSTSGHTYGAEEQELVRQVLGSGVLLASASGFVRQLEREFAGRYNIREAIACSSCTTGLQAALAVSGLPAASEVITTPMTDIGGVSAILQAGHIPVFVDVDAITGNIDPKSVRAAISADTRAMIVTHLVGNPCDMAPLMAIAKEHALFVIEDCAQAYDATYAGRPVGSFGNIGVFSTQQSKHVSSGEGGLMITDDPALALALRVWINKGVAGGVRARDEDHPVVGMNARMGEMAAAVALAQLRKLTNSVSVRIARADELREALSDIKGLTCPRNAPGSVQTYWKFLVSIDPDDAPGLRNRLADALAARAAIVSPCYLHLPLFAKTLFTSRMRRLVGQPVPTYLDPRCDNTVHFPGMRAFIERAIVMWWNERVSSDDVRRVSTLVHEIALG